MLVLPFFNLNGRILLARGGSKGALIFFIGFQNGIGAFEFLGFELFTDTCAQTGGNCRKARSMPGRMNAHRIGSLYA